jgi:imidazolonepropionase
MKKVYLHLNEILTLEGAVKKDGRKLVPTDLSLIQDGAVVVENNDIVWVGATPNLPTQYQSYEQHVLTGHVFTPELVDSHTHIVFGGDRAQEYADRLNGVSYEEIRKRGGGILLTMNKTNHASMESLYESACRRIERLYSYGIGAIEIKSGYGLNFAKEKEISRLIHKIKKHFEPRVRIFNTFLAAHDVPSEFKSSSEYMDQVVLPLLEELAKDKIIDAVDIFHEKNYFTDEDTKKLFEKARTLGVPRKIHADELNDNNGATLAVDYDALSADHLLKISDKGIRDIADSDTVATLLPGTAFFLGKPLAPARSLLDAGAKVALASDYNPGSCHCDNLLLIGSLAAPQLKLNQAELWCGMTLNAAHALGFRDQGAILPGMKARFALFKAESLSHITYQWGRNLRVSLP